MKKIILILFLFILAVPQQAFSQSYWSNIKDGPTTIESAKQKLYGRKLDLIEGIWYGELGSILVFKEGTQYKVYLIQVKDTRFSQFNGTWEATATKNILETQYFFYSRIWYWNKNFEITKYRTQKGYVFVINKFNSLQIKYDELSEGGNNMDLTFQRTWPQDIEKYNLNFTSQNNNIKKNEEPSSVIKNSDYKSYWWVLVLLAAVVFYVYSQTTSNKKEKIANKSDNQEKIKKIKKDSKVKQENDVNMFTKFIKDFYQGNVSLPMSYWVVYGLGSIFNLIIYMLVEKTAFGVLFSIYMISFYIFSTIGTWRSAVNYKLDNQKRDLSGAWGTITQVIIVLGVLRTIVEIIKIVSKL
jgi:hypothetical protein